MKNPHIIVIHGAPGSGKSTTAALLHEKLRSPWFEFGWIPEFRNLNPHTEISFEYETEISFENLVLVVKNYIRHGFENIIITDINFDSQILRLPEVFKGLEYRLFTLYANDDTLKNRILTRDNGNTFRDWEEALKTNALLVSRPLLPNETRICTENITAAEAANKIIEEGDFIIIPKNIPHRPICQGLVKCLLIETEGTLTNANTGGAYDINSEYKYQEASISDLDLRWNKNIADNIGDERWVNWKTQVIKDNINKKCKTFVVLYGEDPVGEGTLIFSQQSVEINALRIDKRHEGKGHISKLVKVMERYAKNSGYETAVIGVEAKETRNFAIYLHWGYDTFVKSEISEIEEEGLVLFYSKKLYDYD
jgi:GNAT superfamily N-acetyltransferase/cytidylate kinase